MHLIPQIPLTTANGKIGCGLQDLTILEVAVGSADATNNFATVFSNVDNFKPFAEADICVPEAVRLVWRPIDNLDFGMYDINTQEDSDSRNRETALVAYATGVPASAKFNIELYWNFEYIPTTGSINVGSGALCDDQRDPAVLIHPLLFDDSVWVTAYQASVHSHNTNTISRNLNMTVEQRPTEGKFSYKENGITYASW